MDSEFPSNKNMGREKAVKPEPKKVEKIVSGEVVRRKPPISRRFMDTFFGGHDAKGVWEYVMFDVMIPAAKDMVSDAVSGGVERTLFGESRPRGGRRPLGGSGGGYVSYNRYSAGSPRRERDHERPTMSRRSRPGREFDEIILDTRVEAEAVIDQLYHIVAEYEVVTVADLNEMLGVASEYTDGKWGWTDIRDAGVTRVRTGYLLNLPRPEPID